MCIKSYKVSSSSSFITQTTALNPSAKEWQPDPRTPKPPPLQPHQLLPRVMITPHLQPADAPTPPQMADVQVVLFAAAPPHELSCQPPQPPFYHSAYNFASYKLGLSVYGPCSQSLSFSPPYACPYVAGTPVFGGGAKLVAEEERLESPTEKVQIPAMRSPKEKKSTRRQEWRRKKSYSGNIEVAGGGAAASLSPPSAVPPAKEFSSSLKTTVMIKNIPNQLRRDFMLGFLDSYCKEYSLEYDFLYLPMDFRRMDNLGYAFVNFTTAEAAQKFKDILQNYKWDTVKTEKGSFTSKKICEITWARIQGKNELVERFQHSTFACDRQDFLPVVLDPPRNGSDPKPAPPLILGNLHKRVSGKIY